MDTLDTRYCGTGMSMLTYEVDCRYRTVPVRGMDTKRVQYGGVSQARARVRVKRHSSTYCKHTVPVPGMHVHRVFRN